MTTYSLYSVIKKVLSTEKASLSVSAGVFTVYVDGRSDKLMIKRAFESIYGVVVSSVNVLRTSSKKRKFRGVNGRIGGLKKAFVKVVDAKQIDFTKISG